MNPLEKYSDEINIYCKRNGIKKLSLFGSYLKDNYSEKSDVDLLVEFEENSKIGLLAISRMERELSAIINKKIDLRTREELSIYYRENVIKEAEVK